MVQLLHLYRWHWAIHLGLGLWGVTWSCVYHTGFVVGLLVFLEAYGMESDMNIHKHSRPNVTLNGGLWMFMTCLVCPFIWWLRPENSKKKLCIYTCENTSKSTPKIHGNWKTLIPRSTHWLGDCENTYPASLPTTSNPTKIWGRRYAKLCEVTNGSCMSCGPVSVSLSLSLCIILYLYMRSRQN